MLLPLLAAGAAEHACLDLRIRRLAAEPDGEKRLGEIVALDGSLHRTVHIDLETRARLVAEIRLARFALEDRM